jgi:hypothetical protein
MTVPFAFANLSGNIALSKLDSNFNTPITIGNTSVLLGNTVTTLNNLTLANVTITSGTSNIANVNVTNIAVTNLTATLANVTTLNVASASITSANIGNLSLTNALSVANGGTGRVTLPANNVLVGNGTGGIATVAPGNVGNVLTSIGGAWVSNAVSSTAAAGSNTQVQYNNSGALGASANLVFDGTNLGIGTSSPGYKLDVRGTLQVLNGSTTFLVDSFGAVQAPGGVYINTTGTRQAGFNSSGTDIRFRVGNADDRMILDASGNLGLGITPSVWGVNFKALQVSYTGVSYNNNNGNSQYTSNVYWNASNAPVYISSSFATQYTQAYTTGQHQWYIAPSGTAGNAITFTQAMTLDASGNLGIGTTSPGAKLDVNGNALVNGLSLGKGISSGANNTVFGLNAGNSQTTGASNTIIGSGAGASITTAANCTFIGRAAGNGGSGNAGSNTGVGEYALAGGSAIGIGNTGIGAGGILANTNSTASIYNSALGYAAFNGVTSGSYNTALGWQALITLTTETNCSGLGAGSTVTGSNQVQLGDSATTTYVYGTVQNRSDLRDKADVRDTQLGLAFVNALRPVDYKLDMRDDYKPPQPEIPEDPTDPEYKVAMAAWREACNLSNLTHDGSKKRLRYHHGLIAQEVKAVLDAQGIDFGGYQDHKIKGGDDVLSIGYDELIAPLIKSIQELTARIAQLEAK